MSLQKYKLLIYPRAEKDLLEIKDYFEKKLKISVNQLFGKFNSSLNYLETNPFIHPLLKDPSLNQLGYRMILVDNYLIFYVVENSDVQIHRILFGKRNYSHLF